MTKRTISNLLPVCLGLGLLCTARTAQPADTRSLENQLLTDAADGTLESFTLWEASLVAGGIGQRDALESYNRRFAEFCRDLEPTDTSSAAPATRARTVLQFLHRRILTGEYDPTCTEMARTLDTGDFNCVTSTVLYNCLCQHVGLTVAIVAEPGHVYSRHHGDLAVDVQNTSPSGFGGQMLAARPIELVSGRSLAYRSGAPLPQREITDTQLIAKIYYNRGVSLMEARQFEQALTLLRQAAQLDKQDDVASGNILACINNWALDLCDHGRYQQAAAMLDDGLKISSTYAPFWENDLHVHHRWISDLVERGEFSDAIAVLRAGYRRRPDAPLFSEGRVVVYQVWIDTLRSSGDYQALYQVAAAARREFPGMAWPPRP